MSRLRASTTIAGLVLLYALAYALSTTSLWLIGMPAITLAGAALGYVTGTSWRQAAFPLTVLIGFEVVLLVLHVESGPDLAWWGLPGLVGGIALRRRRDTAEELAERVREVKAEQELYTELSVRNERARIAAELHDIVGHAISVMVVQAAAGQRLADAHPELASQALTTIAESARAGRNDLTRLVDMLGGQEVQAPDLSVIEEIVRHAASSGLDVTCRFEGELAHVPGDIAQLVVRVAQEGVTNALRYAPGAFVRLLVQEQSDRRALTVEVLNGPPQRAHTSPLVGTGNGLRGLRERVGAVGGSVEAGSTDEGGWRVVAVLPARAAPEEPHL